MIVRHWVATNGSGMHHVAEQCAQAERLLGHESLTLDVAKPDSWDGAEWADVHVLHTNIPECIKERSKTPYKYVFVAHGTPEVCMQSAVDEGDKPGIYAPSDCWMLLRNQLRAADAVVTFWQRHQTVYQSMVPKERHIHGIPLGVDRAFWAQGASAKYDGTPSVWTSENQHRVKWMLDVLMAWPWVLEMCPGARLHGHHIPTNLHRFFIDLANTNGAAYGSYLSSARYSHDQLRSMWKGFDFFLSPVRYGDHNNLSMQAGAAGLKVISYVGNVYADYWIPEGDQRTMAWNLAQIFTGAVPARADKQPVPDLKDMGEAMVNIYESIL